MERRTLSPSGFRPIPRRGVSRTEAATYIGVSTTKFDQLVGDGRMPKPRKIDARRIWDIRALDDAFDALPGGEERMERNPWDDIWSIEGDSPKARTELISPVVFKTWAPGEWEQKICGSPLGKRELAGLGAYFNARNDKLGYIKGVGISTIERLEARGFISVAERRGDRVPYYRITPKGEAEWRLRLQKA